MKKLYINGHTGQALISLLVFMIIAISITSAAIVVVIVGSLSTARFQQGDLSYYLSENGIENTLIRLLRDANYTGETITTTDGTTVVTVTSGNPRTITSIGQSGNFKRTIEVEVDITNNVLSVLWWNEVL